MIINKGKFDVVSSFQEDPFVGHLSTPITNSNLAGSDFTSDALR